MQVEVAALDLHVPFLGVQTHPLSDQETQKTQWHEPAEWRRNDEVPCVIGRSGEANRWVDMGSCFV